MTHSSLPPAVSNRLLISDVQREMEKQTGYRSNRKRRSALQYDYEVYHPLEEVSNKAKL